jgi:tetratricopeptide (TPR) repeat protein
MDRREMRVFVSSTFRDLQSERGYLMKQIFPKIRAACRERGVEFTEIDLRWGLTDEDASLGRVIRTCLEEIDHCRPYFLGMLGDRYGWMPPLAEVQKDYQLLHRYPWIEDAVIGGASLVELEFMSGFLNDPHSATGAFVYARPPEAGSPEERRKLTALREKIIASGRPLHDFAKLEEFGEMVYRDLLGAIERDFPLVAAESPLDVERRLHEVFAGTRRKAYIANQTYYQALQEFVSSESGPLVVHGVSGAGKSALMSYFSAYQRRTNPKAFVITHFVGASPSGSDAQTILRHILGEIRERYAIPEDIPDTKEQLEQLLPTWLARVQDENLLLVIDAVNQLPEPDNLLAWLPEYVPPNIRLIVTTTPGGTLDNLLKSAWQQLALRPLDNLEREALIVRFLGEYHKAFDQSQLRKIARDPKAASPLFLRTLLEEVRLTGEHSLLDEMIDHYLRARNIDELFQLVLERMEEDYGRDLVVDVLSFIAQSRHGLSETELMEVVPLLSKDSSFENPLLFKEGAGGGGRVRLSILLLALDYHLMRPNGRYTFFHDYLRNAVNKRYLSNPSIARERHRSLAKYFATQPISARRIEEEPWHWKEAGEPPDLVRFLSRLDVLLSFAKSDKEYQLLQYWVSTNEEFDEAYDDELETLKVSGPESEEYLSAMLAVANFYQIAGNYGRARSLFEEVIARVETLGDHDQTRLKALNALGNICSERGEYAESEKLLNEALTLGESLFGSDSPMIVDNLINLATLRYTLRNLDEAEALFQRALRICQKAEGFVDSRQIELLTNIGAVLYQKGELEKAKSSFDQALSASERVNGPDHTETANVLISLGAVLIVLKRPQEALPLVERAAQIDRRMLGPHHNLTLSALLNLGMVAYAQGKFELAESTYRDILPVFSKNQGPSAFTTLNVKNNLAMALSAKGSFKEAEELLLQTLETYRTIYGEDHSETLNCYLNLARHYGQAGKLAEAKQLYDLYLPRYSALVGENHHTYRDIEQHYRHLLEKMSEPEESYHARN